MSCLIATTASERDGDNELFHGVIDTGLYTFIGPKPYNYPVVPSPGDRLDPDGSFISGVRIHDLASSNNWKSLLIPNWITHDVPYMAFAPSVNPFKHPLLKSLDYNLESIPIVLKSNGRYVLDIALQKDWQYLEIDIRSFLRALMRVAQAPLEHGFRLWSMPLQHGYTREYNSDGFARIRALRSRNAFIPQIAACSFFIHFIHHQAKIRIDILKTEYSFTPSDPSDPEAGEASKTFWTEEQIWGLEERRERVHRNWEWEKRLREETHLTEDWLSYFKSVLDEPVVGGYMDVHQSRCLSLVPVFCAAKIPLVLFWGPVTKDLFAPPSLHGIIPIPTFDTVTFLISGRKPYVPSTENYESNCSFRAKISTASVPSETKSTRSLRLPRITGGTQPRPQEGLFAFLKRRESARAAVIAKETLSEKQSRLQREENAKRDMPPGRKGARVYYWEWAQGIRTRTSAGRNNYEDLWERYGARQRHYDSVADEWDVCTDLAPDDDPEGNDWDNAEDDVSFPFAEPLPDTDDLDNSQSSGDYLERLHHQIAAVHPPVEFQDAPDIIAYLRYGFREAETRPATTNGKIWRQTMDMLGSGRGIERPLSHSDAGPSLATHLQHLLKAAQLSDAPQTYDLHNRRADFPFTVEWARCGMSSCYALTTVDRNPYPFVLSLPSAAAVIEISRQYPLGSLKVADVIPYLIHKGMAFDTLVESNSAYTAPIRKRLPSLLGYRSPEFCADLSAYLAYEHRRDTFLRSQRGRAALKYGGLISRLARNVVSIGDVLDGPTDEALYATDRALSVWNPIDGFTLFDDRLTDTEIDLICGTYDVATGIVSNNGDMQTAQRSWWPRPAAWKVCGLNCGYWSPDAEDWFQRRLEKIRTNASDVLLHTNNEWRPKLKFNKDAARLCQVNEKLAAEYLESIFHFETRRSQSTVLPKAVQFV